MSPGDSNIASLLSSTDIFVTINADGWALTSRVPASSPPLRITFNPSDPIGTNHQNGMEVQIFDSRIPGAPQ
jgi:hypothetical protein